MDKILISWEAYREDFETRIFMNQVKREKKTLHTGPTFSLHKDFPFEYTKHLLLNSPRNAEDIDFSSLLVKELSETFPNRVIESRSIELRDPLDIAEIFKATNDLLLEHRRYEVDVFISTGLPNMRVAWFLAQPNFKQNLNLFQIREAKFSKNNSPEKVYVNVDSFNPNALNILNEIVNRPVSQDKIFYPETLLPVYEKAMLIARTKDVGCLILGENGTGKENLALYIHRNSERHNKEFKAVNCAAYSDDLLRSELFGHEKGSFTGADRQKTGLFEEANGGTILLDEIGDISTKMQVSLLRVMQEKKIQRVGGSKDIPVNVRIIAATNKDLEELCDKELFRWDLFFRIATTILKLPALRNWEKGEIKKLIEHLNMVYFPEFPNRDQKLKFSKEVIDLLCSYHFKGNVRELQNLIISLYTFCDKEITLADIPERITKERIHPQSDKENIRVHTLKVLSDKKWNIKLSAETLGIARETLYKRIEQFQLKNPNT